MCLNVGAGKMSIEDVKFALDNQVLLKKANSAEPQGLFLTAIHYPEGMV
jgi:tRNA U38,U39,U40 pseudouridine synthase TruA